MGYTPKSFRDHRFDEIRKGILTFLGDSLELLGQGRHRTTYRLGDRVLKFPRNDEGCFDNVREARIYEEFGRKSENEESPNYAECEIWLIAGIPLLSMEYVEPAICKLSELPDWAGYIDCYQVGHTHDGLIVAYDYAS